MLIDWFTVVAQLINFAILLVALKLLLYDRIVEAMEERRRTIEEQEERAEQARREADERAEELEEDRHELRARRDEILDEARRDAEERRRELLDEARRQVESQEQQWRKSARARQDRLLADLQRVTGRRAAEISRRALRDLADAELEHEMVRGFEARLDALEGGERDELVAALRDGGSPLLVRTAFELPEEERGRVREHLRSFVDDQDREVEWERDPQVIAGIVLEAGARRVGWTIEGYLDVLEGEFAELLRSEIEAGAPEPESGREEASEPEASS